MPWLVAVAVCLLAALSVAAFGLGAGSFSPAMVAVGFIALVLAVVVTQVRAVQRTAAIESMARDFYRMDGAVQGMAREQRELKTTSVQLTTQLAGLRAEHQALGESLQQGITSLRESHETITDSLRALLERPQPSYGRYDSAPAHAGFAEPEAEVEMDEPAPAAAEPAPAAETPPPFGDALNLALEPIIDLYTSQTAHYRMVLGMTSEQGRDVPHDVFVHHADRMNLRDQLDVFVTREAIGILFQLRQRDPNLSIFVPIGAATLSSPTALEAIMKILRDEPTLSSGVVFDVPHAVLASLPDASLEGLARLARAGVTLSLSNASISGIDLNALGKLNVRYVGLAAASIGIDSRISHGLAGFVQAARALRIQVVISQVGDPHHVPLLSRVARFACGPAFANPRRLRRNPQMAQQFNAAA